MAARSIINPWNAFLKNLAEHLKKQDVEDLKFLFLGDVLPDGKAEDLNAQSVLMTLHRNGVFDSTNLKPLKEILLEIGRRDLLRKVDAFQRSGNFPTEMFEPLMHDQVPNYWMKSKPRGICLILSNNFLKSDSLEDKKERELAERPGTEKDVESLMQTFEWLGFTIMQELNKSRDDIIRILKQAAVTDHSEYDCFVCCIMSHGYKGGIYANDGEKIELSEIGNFFHAHKCESLMNKPKLFFVQACQGENDNIAVTFASPTSFHSVTGSKLQSDGPPSQQSIPTDLDMLFVKATTPGNISWRDPETGSWFIQQMCYILQRNAHHHNLNDMLLIIKNELAKKKESTSDGATAVQVSDDGMNSLSKKLYFNPSKSFGSMAQNEPVESPDV